MIDNLLNREYKLYQVNARDIYTRLNRDYNIPKVRLQMFNSETGLSRNIGKIKEHKKDGYKYNTQDIDTVKSIIKKIQENEYIDPMSALGARFGYELMPIAISVDGDFENYETRIELIDGFRRMFCVKEVPNVDILVKVYGKLNDSEWINSMMIYNSWKFAKGEKANVFMDRGFELGIYHRFGLELHSMELIYIIY